jgi:hypothetical protein
MCKYCEKNEIFDLGSNRMYNYSNRDTFSYTNCRIVNDTLITKIYLSHDESYPDDDFEDATTQTKKHTIKIKYCPFCGKKLKTQNEKKCFIYLYDENTSKKYLDSLTPDVKECLGYIHVPSAGCSYKDDSGDLYWADKRMNEEITNKINNTFPGVINLNTDDIENNENAQTLFWLVNIYQQQLYKNHPDKPFKKYYKLINKLIKKGYNFYQVKYDNNKLTISEKQLDIVNTNTYQEWKKNN